VKSLLQILKHVPLFCKIFGPTAKL